MPAYNSTTLVLLRDSRRQHAVLGRMGSRTMAKSQDTIPLEGDVLSLTPKGQTELQNSGTSLTPGELELLVLIDGKSTVGETSARMRTLGKQELLPTCLKLLRKRFIQHAT